MTGPRMLSFTQISAVRAKIARRIARSDSLVYVPALIVSGVLGYRTIHAIVARAGHPAVPLDDTFIHFQYARNLAAGHFFTYSPGDSFTAGATSLIWPVLLAPLYLLGLRDLSIIWAAWILGLLAHAALIVETYRLARRLTGPSVAMGAGAMSGLFGAFIWFAASGMETIPLAWILTRTARASADWCEADRVDRTLARRNELALLGLFAPLLRPEGALASLMAAVALAVYSPGGAKQTRSRLYALAPIVGVAILPLIDLVLTGSATSTTALVKWLPLSPYYPSLKALWVPVQQNISLLFNTLLNGEQWSALFVPKGSMPWAVAALVAIPALGWRSNKRWSAAFALLLALGMLIPCTYLSFLWNRLRYLWPFAPGWFVGFACLARLIGELAATIRPRWIGVSPVLSAGVAGLLSGYLTWSIDDVTQSASAIDRQQVTLGQWAKLHLANDAVLGVNDTGAIAYTSDRRTFDVVGLTTAREARYWVAGAGSRFEHYEKLVSTDPKSFPNYFLVYPQWMACPPVLGPELYDAAVYDQTILGGTRMVVYPARLDLLGSGARPVQMDMTGELLDELDIADIESESLHGYQFLEGGRGDSANRVHSEADPLNGDSTLWADGGRFERIADTFEAHLPNGLPARGIGRFVGPGSTDTHLSVEVNGTPVATLHVPAGHATEAPFEIPADLARPVTRIRVLALSGSVFGSLHYWFEKRESG
jgi:hypothetical protein